MTTLARLFGIEPVTPTWEDYAGFVLLLAVFVGACLFSVSYS